MKKALFAFAIISEVNTDGKTATITGYKGSGGDVVIPKTIEEYSVTSIGKDAFSCCESLTSVEIPSSVTSIGAFAFCGCTSLTSVQIQDSVTSIGESAFGGCTSLTSVYIYGNAPSVGYDIFYYTPDNLTVYHTADATGWTDQWCGKTTAVFAPVESAGNILDLIKLKRDGGSDEKIVALMDKILSQP